MVEQNSAVCQFDSVHTLSSPLFERTTKAGKPCYFLHCRDTEGIKFSIVCWEWQWARLQGSVEEGANLEVIVRVPKDGFSAFTLA